MPAVSKSLTRAALHPPPIFIVGTQRLQHPLTRLSNVRLRSGAHNDIALFTSQVRSKKQSLRLRGAQSRGAFTCCYYWYVTVFPLLDPAYPYATSTPGMLKACGRVLLSTASVPPAVIPTKAPLDGSDNVPLGGSD